MRPSIPPEEPYSSHVFQSAELVLYIGRDSNPVCATYAASMGAGRKSCTTTGVPFGQQGAYARRKQWLSDNWRARLGSRRACASEAAKLYAQSLDNSIERGCVEIETRRLHNTMMCTNLGTWAKVRKNRQHHEPATTLGRAGTCDATRNSRCAEGANAENLRRNRNALLASR